MLNYLCSRLSSEVGYQLPKSKWLSPPTDTCNPRGVTRGLPASWIGIGYLMENWADGGRSGKKDALRSARQKRRPLAPLTASSSKLPADTPYKSENPSKEQRKILSELV
ncbi:hypothetical protein EVAR_87064_1 [Eumeta japonica]|uniref:Uncharacterized protein n=1 Tax=Eumeta variegata TaxID=151549 RepID=A0A4C1VQ70_EUMVA|nr:hypothetical protein EVAR_87064_1 [Eumeta japonica]